MRTHGNATRGPDRWFETAKRICAVPPVINTATLDAIAEAIIVAPADAALGAESERLHAADAVAVVEAAQLGASVGVIKLLEHLHEFNTNAACCEDLDQEIRDLLTVARGVRP